MQRSVTTETTRSCTPDSLPPVGFGFALSEECPPWEYLETWSASVFVDMV